MRFPLLIDNATMPATREADDVLPAMSEEDFRAFYERTARPLWSYLSRISGSRQQADDLLQEAYYRFYRAGRQYENEAHRRNSLFQIGTNLVRDAARRAKFRDTLALDDESAAIEPPRSHGQLPEERAAMRTDLAKAMQQLDPVQREMLWLAYAQGSSHDEIAAILGLRSVSIRTMLYRAKKKLATALGGGA